MVALGYVDVVGDAAQRISTLIRDGDLATPVDHLPRWKVRDVVAHLGGVHAWAGRIVEDRSMDGPAFTKSKLDGEELCNWFGSEAAGLVALLAAIDPDEPCPNFNPGSNKNVGWWARRQAHETTVHRWDIEKAFGSTTPIDPDLAADGIDEFLDVFVRTRGKQTLTSTLVISATQPGRQWTLTPAQKAGRIDVAPGRPTSDSSGTELTGDAEALLLALWGRHSANDAGLGISGDEAAAASLISL